MPLSPSSTHVLLIPSYNSGSQVVDVVRVAASHWSPVWVIIDGSVDGSLEALQDAAIPGVRIWTLYPNRGKGATVLYGMEEAYSAGFTHALVMDADGQHCPYYISSFMKTSVSEPEAMILGHPIFGVDAPRERVYGRRVGNWFGNLATLWGGIGDTLFGFRVYPLDPSLKILRSIRTGRGFDFDTELMIRLYWQGVPPRNLICPVYYPSKNEGGISHFRYVRDNLLLVRTHIRLFFGMLKRMPQLLCLRKRTSIPET